MFVRIGGKRHCLYRAVDQEDVVIDIAVQKWRGTTAAARLFRRLIQRQGDGPHRLVMDKLKCYPAAHRQTMPGIIYETTIMQTTERRLHTNQPGEENEPCDDLNPSPKRATSSGSGAFKVPFGGRICDRNHSC